MTSEPLRETNWASMTVDTLDLTVRARNCLEKADITSVGELVKKTPPQLLLIPAMGRKTVRDIQKALADWGLHLGMEDAPRYEDDDGKCQMAARVSRFDAFLQALEQVRSHGVIRDIADLLSKTPQEVAALPGLDAEAVRHIEDGLAKWGLSFGTWLAPESIPSGAQVEGTVVQPGDLETVRDELLHAVEHLLAGHKSNRFRCFEARYGLGGGGRLRLQDMGERGADYGFGAPVSRERVRQVVEKAEEALRRRADCIEFANWTGAVLSARERVPATIDRVIDTFGYGSCAEPADTFAMLRRMADIFSLEFPFDTQAIRGTEIVTADAAGCVETLDVVRRLMAVNNDSYYETAGTAKAVGCEVVALERVIGGPFGWEFLDKGHRYFWTRPCLPPNKHRVWRGNAVLAGLCRVFSVAREVAIVDLEQAVGRDYRLRKAVPREVIEGIADRSGLFDLEEGVLRKKAGQEWFCLSGRDRDLLRVCVEHGRVVSSQILKSSLVRSGLTGVNANAVITYSPLLVHTKVGHSHVEGLYKFVCSSDEVVMALGEGGPERNGRAEEPTLHPEDAEDIVRIPVSSPRVRLSGTHFASEPLDLDGEWRVLDVDGAVIGTVTISGQLVEGLCSVIEALDLETNAVLQLQRQGDGDLLGVRG